MQSCGQLVRAMPLTGPPPPAACLPQPVPLNTRAYLKAALPSGLLACLCLLQAFGYRLRRVIAAFYFPKVCPPASPPSGGHTPACTQPPIGPTLGDVFLLCAVSLAPEREEADLVPLQRSLKEESSLHPAEEGYHREAGKTAEGSRKSRPVPLGLRTGVGGHLPLVHPAPTKVPSLLTLSEFSWDACKGLGHPVPGGQGCVHICTQYSA